MWGSRDSKSTLPPPLSRRVGGIAFFLGVLAVSCSSILFTPRRAFTATMLDGRVYAIGGWNGQATQLNVVESVEPHTMQWRAEPGLNIARSQHASVIADGAIWVIGGWSAERGLVPAVEIFSPNEKTWRMVTNLPTPRREPATALLGRRIIVAGGFNGVNDGDIEGYLDIAEAYELDVHQWQRLARLNTARRGLNLVAVENNLYAINGYAAGDGFLNTVERYDAARDSWQTLDWKIIPRTWAASLVVDNSIIILGGFNRDGFLSTVERIDPSSGAICHPRPLNTPRSWLAATTVDHRVLTLGGEQTNGIGNTIEMIDVDCVK